MIKLFWNTHNQKKTITDNKNLEKEEALNLKWGVYHKKNSDIWVYEILKKIKYNIIQNEKDLNKEDILIIVDSNPEKKIELYTKLNLTCSKILLFHLGDETGSYDLSEIYKKSNIILLTMRKIWNKEIF